MLTMSFMTFVLCLLVICWNEATTVARLSRHERSSQSTGPVMVRRATTHSASPWRYFWSSSGNPYGYSTYPTYTPTTAPPKSTPKHDTPTPTAGSDPARWLAAHNKVRAQYGDGALSWDSTLEGFAKQVTDKCIFKHTVNNQYGENLAAGQLTLEDVVHDWVAGSNEKDSYTPSAPRYSHFTQVVWKSSTRVGCAVTSCEQVSGISLPQSPVLVYICEYDPPGNVEGEYAENVKARQGGAPAV